MRSDLIARATGRTWVRWRRLAAVAGRHEGRRLYVHLCEPGARVALCGRVTADRKVEAEPKRVCPHCTRLSK